MSINESINQRVRAEIVVHLKTEGLYFNEDYTYSGGLFIARDIETAQAMADAVAGKFRCVIYDNMMGDDGKAPMMIVK